jgi:hypothetical protein
MKRFFVIAFGFGWFLVALAIVVFLAMDKEFFPDEAKHRARLPAEDQREQHRRREQRRKAKAGKIGFKPFPIPAPASSALSGAQLIPPRRYPEAKLPLTPERVPFRVSLMPMFAGESLYLLAFGSVSVSLYDWQEKKSHRKELTFDAETIDFDGLVPGSFTCTILLDAEPMNPPGFPGDFRNLSLVFHRGQNESAPVPVPLLKLMQVTQPVDNSQELSTGFAATDTITLAWEPIPQADRYVVEFGRAPHRWPRKSFSTTETSITISELVPDRYLTWVEAFRGREKIGETCFHMVLAGTLAGRRYVNRNKGPLPVAFFSSSTQTQEAVGEFMFAGNRRFFPPETKMDVTVWQALDKTLINPVTQMSSGTVVLKDLKPGTYDIRVIIDENPANPPGFPGDLLGNAKIPVGSQTVRFGVYFYRMMRLVHPEDTENPKVAERIKDGGIPLVKSPVLVEWDSLGPGVRYDFYASPGNTHGTTTATAILLNLAPNQTHNLRLSAFSQRGCKIGELMLVSPDFPSVYPIFVEAMAEEPFQEMDKQK